MAIGCGRKAVSDTEPVIMAAISEQLLVTEAAIRLFLGGLAATRPKFGHSSKSAARFNIKI